MRKTGLVVLSVIWSIQLFSQNDVVKAFSASYVHEAAEQYTEAIADLNTVYSEKSYNMNLRLGWLYYASGEYYKSMAYYGNAIVLEPKSIEARMGYIYPLSAMENWEDVLKTYMEIIEIDPNNSIANYRLAYMYFLRKDWATAQNHLSKVLALYPFDYDANLLMGSIYIKMGEIAKAKKHLELALQYDPTSTDAESLLKTL